MHTQLLEKYDIDHKIHNNTYTFLQKMVLPSSRETNIFFRSFGLKIKLCSRFKRKREIHANIVKRMDDTMREVQY